MSFRDRLGRSKHCNCRQNQPRGRRWLEIAASAWLAFSPWLLKTPQLSSKPAPGPQMVPTLATSSPLGSAGALDIDARACSAPPGRAKSRLEPAWPLEPARLRWSARNGRSNSLGLARKHRTCRRWRHRARSAPLGRSKWPLEPARLRWGARDGRSSPLGSAGALEMAARIRSAPPGRSKLLGLAGRKHRTCRRFRVRARSAPLRRSSPLGSAGALEMAARTRSASPGRSKLLGLAARKHCTCRRFRVRAR